MTDNSLTQELLGTLTGYNPGATTGPDPRFGRFSKDGTPRLSPSSINLVLKCPGKWKRVYLDNVPEPPGWQADLGSLGHEGIERILRGEDVPVVLDAVRDAALIHISTQADTFQNPPGDAVDHAHALRSALSKLVSWVESESFEIKGLEEEVWRRYEWPDITFDVLMRYDALVENLAGEQYALDWKFPQRQPWNLRSDYIYATGMYVDALQDQGRNVHGFGVIHAPQDGNDVMPIFKSMDKDLKRWIDDRTRQALDVILAGEFPYDPVTPGPLCSLKWCSQYPTCPAVN